MTSRPSQTAHRQVFIYIPKIYEPLSDSESEQELAEHDEIKMLFFPRVNRKTKSNHFENFLRTLSSSAVKLHCVDVVLLNVDKKKVNTWTETIAFVFPSISVCYKGPISNKKYFRREFQLSIMKKTVL